METAKTNSDELFRNAPEGVLRLGRWIAAQGPMLTSPEHKVELALRAHEIARSDVALTILTAALETSDDADVLAAHARVCIELLRLDDAAKSLSRYRQVFGVDVRLIALELAAARASGTFLPGTIDKHLLGEVFAVAPLNELENLLSSFSSAHVPMEVFARAFLALAPRSRKLSMRLMAHWLANTSLQTLSWAASCLFIMALNSLRPGRKIHIVEMGKFTRLAHLIDGLDPILRRLTADGGAARHHLYVLYFDGYPNTKILELMKRHCTFINIKSKYLRKIVRILIVALRKTNNFVPRDNYHEIRKSMLSNPALLRFERREEELLVKRAEELGVDTSRRFILFGLRDMAYYKLYGEMAGGGINAQRAATYHRCPSLETYAAVANAWAQAGYQVIRMGLRVSEALPSGLDPRVIDYASGPREDALDAYLFSKCWFLLAGDTGMFAGAAVFDRPSVMGDLSIVQSNTYSSCKVTPNIFIPAMYRDLQSGLLLNFHEMIHQNYTFLTYDGCVSERVEIVHNSVEDLLEATQELSARLLGRYVESVEDRERQRAFHAIYQPSHVGFNSNSVVSSAFLRKYEVLLESR